MKESIESRIKLRAILIYIIILIGFFVIILFVSRLRNKTLNTEEEIQTQYDALITTNKLMYEVERAQNSSGLFISNRKIEHLDNYISHLNNIEKIIDTMSVILPDEKEELNQLYIALENQAQNIINLNVLFSKKEPFFTLDDKFNNIKTKQTSNIISKSDTIITTIEKKKGFFKRLGEAFKPSIDTATIVINTTKDTLKTISIDTVNIYENVEKATIKAESDVISHIREIEIEVAKLVDLNSKSSAEISNLLLNFHNNTLQKTMYQIKITENGITKNYKILTIAGIIALILIFTFIWFILNDINKGKIARKELEVANTKIKNTMDSRHKLLLAVSHDIKTPLNSIIGYLDMMKPQANVSSMKNSSMHILSMLENLLEYSALEQGSLKHNFTIFNIHSLASEIYEMFYPIAKNKNLQLTYSANNIRIYCDKIKLKQIIINLVSNAIKYTKEGNINFSANLNYDNLIITVSDTGVGIPQEKINNIFKPFERIEENSHLSEGSGLGMYVVKGIISILKGQISVQSEINKGSTFTVSIPIQFATREIPHGSKRVKIYDDDPATIKLVTTYLQQLGHTIVDNNPDIIITDMEMGETKGTDILKKKGNVPIIVMTGRGDFSLETATLLGFSGYLAKPFNLESIKEVIGIGDNNYDSFKLEEDEEILQLFKASTKENIVKLNNALNSCDFNIAQATCHKMYPMFAQFGYPTEELKRMDLNKDNEYNGWQNDVKSLLKKIEGII